MSGGAGVKKPDDVLRENWAKASRLTLSATVALFLLSRGAKAGANKLLEAFGLDWSALNPYAIGLFGVPVIAALCIWSLWWARAFAKRQGGKKWYERVVTKADLGQLSDKAKTLAVWSLILYMALPIIGLAALEGKFLHGTFYFSTTGAYSCPKDCVSEGATLAHFWPPHGLQDIWDSPYRYEGDLTYLPPWQPVIWMIMGLGVVIYAWFYAKLLFTPSLLRSSAPLPRR